VFADAAVPSPCVAALAGPRYHGPHPGVGGARRTGGAAAESSKGSTTLPGTGGGRKATRGRSAEVPDAPAALVEALKAWRLDVSRADKVPAYVVLSDAHLAGIAADRPTTLAELANCKGIGPTKLDRYGDEILAVLDAQP
jgi:ATP-dependent DNA helicase RecQ